MAIFSKLITGFLGSIVIISLLLVAYIILIATHSAYWDYQVTKLCGKDGGVKIYETITLTDDELGLYKNNFGQIVFPLENRASEEMKIIRRNISSYIRHNPEVRRDELLIIRKSDNKILANRVTYSKVGGLITSTFQCPEKLEDIFSAIVN